TEDPHVRLGHGPAVARLGKGVLVVGLACLGWVIVRLEQLDLPAGKEPLELTRFVRVARGEPRLQSVHRTSATFSRSAIRATSRGAGRSRGKTRSSSKRRRSPSWLTSTELIRPPARSISSITSPGV